MRSQFWGPKILAKDKNMTLLLAMEPFLPSVYSHGSDSAWPPDRSQGYSPSVLDIQWTDPSLDADGQNVANASKYVNYALFDTPLENLYAGNLKRLRKIRKVIDPEDVMGLAGGWKF
jgi:Berberine and berberine like